MLRSRSWYALCSLGSGVLAAMSAVVGGYAMDVGVGWLVTMMVVLAGLGLGWCLIFLVRAVLPNTLRRWAFKPVPPELKQGRPRIPRSLWDSER
jgi:hypothetical protein